MGDIDVPVVLEELDDFSDCSYTNSSVHQNVAWYHIHGEANNNLLDIRRDRPALRYEILEIRNVREPLMDGVGEKLKILIWQVTQIRLCIEFEWPFHSPNTYLTSGGHAMQGACMFF